MYRLRNGKEGEGRGQPGEQPDHFLAGGKFESPKMWFPKLKSSLNQLWLPAEQNATSVTLHISRSSHTLVSAERSSLQDGAAETGFGASAAYSAKKSKNDLGKRLPRLWQRNLRRIKHATWDFCFWLQEAAFPTMTPALPSEANALCAYQRSEPEQSLYYSSSSFGSISCLLLLNQKIPWLLQQRRPRCHSFKMVKILKLY